MVSSSSSSSAPSSLKATLNASPPHIVSPVQHNHQHHRLRPSLRPSASFPPSDSTSTSKEDPRRPLVGGLRRHPKGSNDLTSLMASSVSASAVAEANEKEKLRGMGPLTAAAPRKPLPSSTVEAWTKTVQESRRTERAQAEAVTAVTRPVSLGLDCGWSSIPHPAKVDRGGEDAHVVCRCNGATFSAVLDGVGGWAELGIDPALYARTLASRLAHEFAQMATKEGKREAWRDDRPLLTILQKAFCHMEELQLSGSCTVCLSLLLPNQKLHCLNLGDSGLHVIRNGESIFRTTEQQHYFNCPMQLGKGSEDRPVDGEYFVLEQLLTGDTIVMATDGVWDNLWEDDLITVVTEPTLSKRSSSHNGWDDPSRQGSPEGVARRISEAAHLLARDPGYRSPFAVNAHRQGLKFTGGKLDDVTVVVSKVCEVPRRPGKSNLKEEEGEGGGGKSRDADCGSPVSSCDESDHEAEGKDGRRLAASAGPRRST